MSYPKAWVDDTEVSVTIDGRGFAHLGDEATPLFAKARAEDRKANVLIEYEPGDYAPLRPRGLLP